MSPMMKGGRRSRKNTRKNTRRYRGGFQTMSGASGAMDAVKGAMGAMGSMGSMGSMDAAKPADMAMGSMDAAKPADMAMGSMNAAKPANGPSTATGQTGGALRAIGSRAEVMHGTAHHTSGGLTRKDLKYNKHGRIVSRRASEAGKKALKRLERAGFKARKGTFKLFSKKGRK